MALVDYSSSSEDEGTTTAQPDPEIDGSASRNALKRKAPISGDLPPLPLKFHDLYAANVRTSVKDDPALHNGRKRVKSHVDGDWPTHIYVEWWPDDEAQGLLTELVKSSKQASKNSDVHSLLTSDLNAPLPLHISLSRSLTLSFGNKAAFLAKVSSLIASCHIPTFTVKPGGCTWVSNYEGTRWFLVISLERPDGDGLNKLLQLCNQVADEYAQPRLYDSATFGSALAPSTPALEADNDSSEEFDRSSCFHVSIAWTLNPPTEEMRKKAREWKDSVNAFKVQDVKAKIGNAVTSIPLQQIKSERKNASLFSV